MEQCVSYNKIKRITQNIFQKSPVEPHKALQVNKVSPLDGSTSVSGSFRGVSLRDLPQNLDKNSRDLENNGLCSVLEVMECVDGLIRFLTSLKKVLSRKCT